MFSRTFRDQRSAEKFGAKLREDYGQIRGQKRVRAWERGPRQGEEDLSLFVFPLGLDVLVMLARRPQTMAEIL